MQTYVFQNSAGVNSRVVPNYNAVSAIFVALLIFLFVKHLQISNVTNIHFSILFIFIFSNSQQVFNFMFFCCIDFSANPLLTFVTQIVVFYMNQSSIGKAHLYLHVEVRLCFTGNFQKLILLHYTPALPHCLCLSCLRYYVLIVSKTIKFFR